MSKARIGIIGAGWWAAANHIPVLKADPDCEIVAVNRLGSRELAEGAADLRYPARLRGLPRDARCGADGRRRRLLAARASLRARHGGAGERLPRAGREAADDDGQGRASAGGAGEGGGARDRRALWLEFQALDRGGTTARQGRRADRARRPADGECARGSVCRAAHEGDGRRDVPPARLHLGRPEGRRRLRLGPARASARPPLSHRRSRAAGGLRRHRQIAGRRRLLRCGGGPLRRRRDGGAVRRRDLAEGQAGADRPPHLRLGGDAPPRHRARAPGAAPPRRQGRNRADGAGDRAAMAARRRCACSSASAAA